MVLKQPESYLGKQQKQRGTLSPGKRCKTVQQCFSPDITRLRGWLKVFVC